MSAQTQTTQSKALRAKKFAKQQTNVGLLLAWCVVVSLFQQIPIAGILVGIAFCYSLVKESKGEIR